MTPPTAGGRKLGAVTIGQSPRVDITPELAPLLPGVELLERGALDDLDEAALEALQRAPHGAALATRLRDGREIVVGEHDVLPRVREALRELAARDVSAILLLCTGSFPTLGCSVPVLLPDRVLQGVVRATFPGGTLGIVTPNEAQEAFQRSRWTRLLEDEAGAGGVRVEAASPYRPDPEQALRRAAQRLRRAGVSMVALDCLGYTERMRHLVRDELGVPVLLARSVLGRVAAEFSGL